MVRSTGPLMMREYGGSAEIDSQGLKHSAHVEIMQFEACTRLVSQTYLSRLSVLTSSVVLLSPPLFYAVRVGQEAC